MRRQRTGSTEAVAVVAVFALLVIVGAGFYFYTNATVAEIEAVAQQAEVEDARAEAAEQQGAVAEERPEEQRPMDPEFAPEPKDPIAELLERENEFQAAANTLQDLEKPEFVTNLVESHLAVGEFGPAIDVADKVLDEQLRSDMLRRIAVAQAEAGEFAAALYSVRSVPDEAVRREAFEQRAEELALAGGGANADFDSLIDLIVRLTGPPESWADQGGPGDISPFQTGVRVDPNGHLSRMTKLEKSDRLQRLATRVREADLNADMAVTSNLRLVSLTRLEARVAELIAEGRPVPKTMKHLAGLSKIEYVFVYPEEGEIVIAGPAEGWRYNEKGAPVGLESGKPTLQLDDFVTVARIFSPGGQAIYTCSIVPRQSGLKAVKDYVEASLAAGPLAPGQVRRWSQEIEDKLGTQDVVYEGVAANTRVANVILEADYRMKLIGIGEEQGVAGMKSFFDLVPPEQQRAGLPLDALRWWLTMKYDAVLHDADRETYEIRGSSVLCKSENELIGDLGERVQTGKTEETNRMFAQLFTQHYDELAARDLVFADLQNVFDLSLVAALIQKEGVKARLGWDMGVFGRDGAYQPELHAPVLTCDSAVNYRVYRGQHIVVQAAGGVRADLWSVVNDDEIVREDPALSSDARGSHPKLPEGRWWWDAAR